MSKQTETRIARWGRVAAVMLATAGVVLITYEAKAWLERTLSVDLSEISRSWHGDSQGFR